MAALNAKAARTETMAADSVKKITNLTSHYKEELDFKKVASQGQFNGKSFYELEQECRSQMAASGLPFDGQIIADGELYRYSCDEKKSKPDEWFVGFHGFSRRGTPYLNVVYGSWSTGEKHYFHSWKKDSSLSKQEIRELIAKSEEQRKRAEEKMAQDEERKAKKAIEDYRTASIIPNGAKAYFDRKQVSPLPSIRYGFWGFEKLPDGTWDRHEVFMFPLRNIDGAIRAIQRIRADGTKRILGSKKGNFFQIGEIEPNSWILVSEGIGTGLPVHEQTRNPLVVAVDCYNLIPVIGELRKKYPENPILILGDDDIETIDKRTGEFCNPGRNKALAAAREYGCRVAFPKFRDGLRLPNGKRPTDWNDLLVLEGVDEVKRQLSELENVSDSLAESEKPIFSSQELQKALEDNECGDADLFRKFSNGDVLFDPSEKTFYVWNGSLWIRDEEKWGRQKLHTIADCYVAEANRRSVLIDKPSIEEKKILKAFRERGASLKTKRRMTDVLDMATTGVYGKGGLTFSGEWDNHPGCIPCSNGILKIDSGNLLTPERHHFIRKSSRVNFDKSASSEEFHSFVIQIMNESRENAAFLRRYFGYASLGHPVEDRFLFLYGKHGRNGKGTLIRCIASVLGDLARTFSPELILLQRNPTFSSTPRPDLIHLKGTRLAIFSEINEGREIDSAILKNLTGRDIIPARSLYSNDVKNFAPTHSIVLQANHKPKASAKDQALWYRAILMPFELSFVDEPSEFYERKVDRHIEEKLIANSSGILRWLVQGAQEYLSSGLSIPKEIAQATEGYRQENDGIGVFLREKCILDNAFSSKREQTTQAIQEFCVDSKFKRPSRNEINDYLREKGFREEHGRLGDRWIGFSIRSDENVIGVDYEQTQSM